MAFWFVLYKTFRSMKFQTNVFETKYRCLKQLSYLLPKSVYKVELTKSDKEDNKPDKVDNIPGKIEKITSKEEHEKEEKIKYVIGKMDDINNSVIDLPPIKIANP